VPADGHFKPQADVGPEQRFLTRMSGLLEDARYMPYHAQLSQTKLTMYNDVAFALNILHRRLMASASKADHPSRRSAAA
jgi:hypothetical protein